MTKEEKKFMSMFPDMKYLTQNDPIYEIGSFRRRLLPPMKGLLVNNPFNPTNPLQL